MTANETQRGDGLSLVLLRPTIYQLKNICCWCVECTHSNGPHTCIYRRRWTATVRICVFTDGDELTCNCDVAGTEVRWQNIPNMAMGNTWNAPVFIGCQWSFVDSHAIKSVNTFSSNQISRYILIQSNQLTILNVTLPTALTRPDGKGFEAAAISSLLRQYCGGISDCGNIAAEYAA